MNKKQIDEYISEIRKTLLANSDKFSQDILLIHLDGMIIQENASIETIDDWIIIWAEHAPPAVFHKDEVVKWAVFSFNHTEE